MTAADHGRRHRAARSTYWLVKVVDRVDKKEVLPLDQVKDLIRAQLLQQKAQSDPSAQQSFQQALRDFQSAVKITAAPQYASVVQALDPSRPASPPSSFSPGPGGPAPGGPAPGGAPAPAAARRLPRRIRRNLMEPLPLVPRSLPLLGKGRRASGRKARASRSYSVSPFPNRGGSEERAGGVLNAAGVQRSLC